MSKSTKRALELAQANIQESMGVRTTGSRPQLSPVPNAKDIGRKPARDFGRLEIERVIPDPNQPRKSFSEEKLHELTESIKKNGILLPILVRFDAALSLWVVVAGERRYRAAKAAGLSFIECRFIEGEPTKSEILEQQLIENCIREDLAPIEQARAFETLMELNHWSGKELAQALRIQPSTVSRALALLKLPTDLQEDVRSGALPTRTAAEISRLPDAQSQRELATKAKTEELSIDDTRNEVRSQERTPKKTRRTKKTFYSPGGLTVTVSSKASSSDEEIRAALRFALDTLNEPELAN